MSDFRWLIEAPGPRYLAVQRLRMSDSFEWTTDHDKALAFRSQDQADQTRLAVCNPAAARRQAGYVACAEHGAEDA